MLTKSLADVELELNSLRSKLEESKHAKQEASLEVITLSPVKFLNFQTSTYFTLNTQKFLHSMIPSNDANGIANSEALISPWGQSNLYVHCLHKPVCLKNYHYSSSMIKS